MVQPFANKVKTYVTVIGEAVVFVSVSDINPVPVAALFEIPFTAERDHEKVVPDVADVALYKNVSPLQMAGGVIVDVSVGFGLIRTTTFSVFEQPFANVINA